MSFNIATNFLLSTPLPLDQRTVAASQAVREAIPAIRRFDGLHCYQVDTATNWQLQGGVANANWTQVGAAYPSWNKYVNSDPLVGNDANDGSVGAPWLTIAHAMTQLPMVIDGDMQLNLAASAVNYDRITPPSTYGRNSSSNGSNYLMIVGDNANLANVRIDSNGGGAAVGVSNVGVSVYVTGVTLQAAGGGAVGVEVSQGFVELGAHAVNADYGFKVSIGGLIHTQTDPAVAYAMSCTERVLEAEFGGAIFLDNSIFGINYFQSMATVGAKSTIVLGNNPWGSIFVAAVPGANDTILIEHEGFFAFNGTLNFNSSPGLGCVARINGGTLKSFGGIVSVTDFLYPLKLQNGGKYLEQDSTVTQWVLAGTTAAICNLEHGCVVDSLQNNPAVAPQWNFQFEDGDFFSVHGYDDRYPDYAIGKHTGSVPPDQTLYLSHDGLQNTLSKLKLTFGKFGTVKSAKIQTSVANGPTAMGTHVSGAQVGVNQIEVVNTTNLLAGYHVNIGAVGDANTLLNKTIVSVDDPTHFTIAGPPVNVFDTQEIYKNITDHYEITANSSLGATTFTGNMVDSDTLTITAPTGTVLAEDGDVSMFITSDPWTQAADIIAQVKVIKGASL